MTVEHEGLPLWEVEIEGLRPVKATAFVAAPTAEAAETAVSLMNTSDLYFEEYACELEVRAAKPAEVRWAEAQWEPDLIVREGDA